MNLTIIHGFDLGAPLVALQWGSCGVPLHAFTRDGRETVIDTCSGCLVESSSLAAEEVARVVCRPHSDRPSFITAHGVLGASDESAPPLTDVRDASWSPNGRFLAVLSGRGLNVWNVDKRKLVAAPPQAGGFELIAWNPTSGDGCGQLAATIRTGVLLWSACGAVTVHAFPRSPAATALAWHPAGRYLAVACQDGDVRIVDPATGQTIRLQGAIGTVRRLLWDHKGAFLIGVSVASLSVWNVLSAVHYGSNLAWTQREAPLTDVALRGMGNLLAAGDIEGRVELLRVNARTAMLRSTDFPSSISHLAWSASGRRLAVGTDGGKVSVVRVCR